MRISKLAYGLIKYYEGIVTDSTIRRMLKYGWVEVINGCIEVAK